jgi:CSLREA domain-containing protein
MKRLGTIALILALVLTTLPMSRAAPAAPSYIVNSTGDVNDGTCNSTHCSLREAMLDANAAGEAGIVFNIPTSDAGYNAVTGVWTISPTVSLPALTGGNVTINGYSQPGAALGTSITKPQLVIEINGTNVTGQNGFNIGSAENVITGLRINRFGLSGVAIGGTGAVSNTISGNSIYYNVGDGVSILLGAQNNTIGGDMVAEKNYIYDNNGDGVGIYGENTSGNVVSRNNIGVDLLGADIGNTGYGVRIYGGAHGNVIGGDSQGERNSIAGNDLDGVRIAGANTRDNIVLGNTIGWFSVSSSGAGVTITDGAHDNTVGSGNTISHNAESGVYIEGTSTMSNTVSGNDIHLNDRNGVHINGAQNNIIGGNTEGERNYIYDNGWNGVSLEASDTLDNNTVSGNYIGIGTDGTAQGNGDSGVYIDSSYHNTIGGDTEGERNVISGNAFGILAWYIWDNVISGNYIGTDANGRLSSGFGNSGGGIVLALNCFDNTIGGDTVYERNVIAGNGGPGVHITGGGGNLITRNSIYANDGDGIDISAGVPAPVIAATLLGSVHIVGTACVSCTVEVFANSDDDSEGEVFIGEAVAGSGGGFVLTVDALPPGAPYLTATATDATNTTSEFSDVFESTIKSVCLPLILRD